jgi:phosphoribosylaminoimidazole-succinocarboxamide synthase
LKEFVRRWLIENGFQGLEGQQIPNMTDEYMKPFLKDILNYTKYLRRKIVKATSLI